jgi:hypothetical protein
LLLLSYIYKKNYYLKNKISESEIEIEIKRKREREGERELYRSLVMPP